MAKNDVVCIGQACTDVLIKGFRYEDCVKGARMRVDNVSLALGGDAANEATILSRLGYSVKIICAIGKDAAGEFVKNELWQNGIDTSGIQYPKNHFTLVSGVLIPEDMERSFIIEKKVRYGDYIITPDMFKNTRLVSLASLFYDPFLEPENVYTAVTCAKKDGSIVCADVSTNKDVKDITAFKESLPYIDYFLPNEEEANFFAKTCCAEDAAEYFLNAGVRHVIIKLGAKGCLVKTHDVTRYIPAIPAEPVDSTGAGDNFVSGFIS